MCRRLNLALLFSCSFSFGLEACSVLDFQISYPVPALRLTAPGCKSAHQMLRACLQDQVFTSLLRKLKAECMQVMKITAEADVKICLVSTRELKQDLAVRCCSQKGQISCTLQHGVLGSQFGLLKLYCFQLPYSLQNSRSYK